MALRNRIESAPARSKIERSTGPHAPRDRRSNARRVRTHRTIEDHTPIDDRATASEASIVDQVDARLHPPAVAIALRMLPEIDREALLLFAWEDQSYEEIAEALEIPKGTVRSRIHRARGRLRELIVRGGKGPNEPPKSPSAREASQ